MSAGRAVFRRKGFASGPAAAALAGILSAAALVAAGAGWSASTVFPAGPIGLVTLAVDPLSAAFLALFLGTRAAAWFAAPPSPSAIARAAALCLALVAHDPFARALGVAVAAGATGPAATPPALVCVGALGPSATAGPAAFEFLAALLVTAGGRAGAVPLAAYLLARGLLGATEAAAPPVWWGTAVMATGAATALLGGWAATQATTLEAIARRVVAGQMGLVVAASGASMLARGLDLGAVAASALAAALLLTASLALAEAVLSVAVAAARAAAGTSIVFRLGGLIVRMPMVAGAVIAVAATLSWAPPGPTFAGAWLLLQVVLALCRAGGFASSLTLAVVAVGAACGIGLGTVALWRMIAVAFLGQPRTPRAAGVEGPGRAVDRALIGLMAGLALVGAFPGLAMQIVMPGIAASLGTVAAAGLAHRMDATMIAASADTPGYPAAAVAILLGACALLAWLARRRAGAERREAPAWNDGLATPQWLPFGEPGAQVTAESVSVSFAPRSAWRPLGRVRRLVTVVSATFPQSSARREVGALVAVAAVTLVAAALASRR